MCKQRRLFTPIEESFNSRYVSSGRYVVHDFNTKKSYTRLPYMWIINLVINLNIALEYTFLTNKITKEGV